MSTLCYEAQHHRLRVAGTCGDDDAPRIREAVLSRARSGEALIVDLTAVTALTPNAARALLDAQKAAEPCRVSMLRKRGSVVDRRLQELEPPVPGRR